MDAHDEDLTIHPARQPWNKDKLISQKPPLRPKHVWSIRTKLQMQGRVRDLAMFNLAIDSKLRGCDVVALRVEDVAPSGYAVDRATVRQKNIAALDDGVMQHVGDEEIVLDDQNRSHKTLPPSI